MKAFVVAGTASGVGKSTAALALCAAFRTRGLRVQAFKGGPDFLDTGHLTAVTGRPARNLDTWMLSHEAMRETFARAAADCDVAIVEGMMGLFDGVSGKGEEGSTAQIAKLLGLPVILVLDASKSARSIAAVIRGFEVFDPAVQFAGVVLNGVAGEGHFAMLADAIRDSSAIPLLGWLPKEDSISIPERHLGLHTAHEEPDWSAKVAAFARVAEKHLALDQLQAAACEQMLIPQENSQPQVYARITIGVTQDKAFCFCYEDNLDALRAAGARIVAFSPLRDAHLPEGVDALYFCGGYPELYAAELTANASLAEDLRRFAESGRPIYAECGGMMYLGRSLRTIEGDAFAMAGVLPVDVEMTAGLVRFGYVEVELLKDCMLGVRGKRLRGHSFHHSQEVAVSEVPAAFQAHYTLSGITGQEGYATGNVLASYIHLHFGGNPDAARSFVQAAEDAAVRIAEER